MGLRQEWSNLLQDNLLALVLRVRFWPPSSGLISERYNASVPRFFDIPSTILSTSTAGFAGRLKCPAAGQNVHIDADFCVIWRVARPADLSTSAKTKGRPQR